jgi:hypothetical protein
VTRFTLGPYASASRLILATLIALFPFSAAFAQQRPLVTEDPETIGAGRLLLESGLDLEWDVFYPVSGLSGDRFAVPTIGVSIGVSSIAEIQIDGGFYQRLSVTDRETAPLSGVLDFDDDDTSDVEDFVLATKVRLVSESGARPALGLRVATKLPNASNESGLGHDLTDFFASLLIGKTVRSVRVVGNAGVAILGDPTSDVPEQNDLMTYGVSIARAMTTAAELVGEVNGRANFANGDSDPGAESRAVVRLGGRYTRGAIRLDAGVIFGLTAPDPQFGFTAGFTWVLDAFRVP